jgi:3-deoxy-7-phosphoheptulonate synthase
LIVEVHPRPDQALSDGDQSLAPAAFRSMMNQLATFAAAAGRGLAGTRTVTTETETEAA